MRLEQIGPGPAGEKTEEKVRRKPGKAGKCRIKVADRQDAFLHARAGEEERENGIENTNKSITP